MTDRETTRLREDLERRRNWKRWGPFLSERQWGTVREDYSADGSVWEYFPHDHARSRAYRWGEDGLLGICDREGRLCFALALWNGQDAILKERLFGLTNSQGNHGEDVKECYYFLDAVPTHSYLRALYKYPQRAYPYDDLIAENARRTRDDPEYELLDTDAFAENRYFDVTIEYAKHSPEDILIRITVANRGPDAASLDLLPSLWFRNTWSWGRTGEGYPARPQLTQHGTDTVLSDHETLGQHRLTADTGPDGPPQLLFTENETNTARLYDSPAASPFVKDAFHERIVHGRGEAVNPGGTGTKAAAWYHFTVPAGESRTVRLRLAAEAEAPAELFGPAFDRIVSAERDAADAFYAPRLPATATDEQRSVLRQAYAGLLWSQQFYCYVVDQWLAGDPAQPPPPPSRLTGRNSDWGHLYNRDVLSMPDTWEYPWYAAWDLAFHMIPFASIDTDYAKRELVRFLREWYMHPSGQLPAYEFNFNDVNPPVHAWACWRVYKMSGARGKRDRLFLERCFQKLLLNFTWWVNRKDVNGRHLFAGGFLGLDNIGVFDRSRPLPGGGRLEQADGTAWMAFFCSTMLSMALELASADPAYEDMASKFFEHFIAIIDAMNAVGVRGLWHEEDGFYYDELHIGDTEVPLQIRSLVGVIPLFACEVLEQDVIDRLPGFRKRTEWFLANRPDLAGCTSYMKSHGGGHRLLAVPSRERLVRVLSHVLDEAEFLSPYGIRSVSRAHLNHPFVLEAEGVTYRVDYEPGEATTRLFGGNSNWRGPVWFPLNYLLIEALERYDHFYGDDLTVEFPTGSGHRLTLGGVARELQARLVSIFLPDGSGARPVHGTERRYADDPHWRDLVLFHEYFHGETGRGLGASHQTGWTALVTGLIEDLTRGAR
ncbi:MAG: glucosidase [Gemmatimonadota bacterium]